MDRQARLRINLAQREFEVEGSEPFVEGFVERVRELWRARRAPPETAGAVPPPSRPQRLPPVTASGTFGEFILRLPPGSTDVDKMLAAGFWTQRASGDDAFATADANRRLTEQGIKLGNPSQCVKQSLLAKRVFMVLRGRYRVSQQGRAHLRQLLGPVVPE